MDVMQIDKYVTSQMEFLYECLCNGQLEELIHFLQMFNIVEFCVYSTNNQNTSGLTTNTIKDIAHEIKNDSLFCPVHGCKITVPKESLILFKQDNMKYIKQKKRKNQ